MLSSTTSYWHSHALYRYSFLALHIRVFFSKVTETRENQVSIFGRSVSLLHLFVKFSLATSPAILELLMCNFIFPSSTLKFVVLDYDKFSRSEFVAEVMFSLLDVDLVEGTTLSLHLNSKPISEVSI